MIQKIVLVYPIHHLLQVGSVSFSSQGLICVERTQCDHIILVDVYFVLDMLFALPRLYFQTGRWLWYWELILPRDLQPCHIVSLIEIPDMLCPFRGTKGLEISTRKLVVLGQKPENPLLLLGQYSDEDLEEESSKQHSSTIVENEFPELDDQQVKVSTGEICEDAGVSKAEEPGPQRDGLESEEHSSSLEALNREEENGTRENDSGDPGDLHIEMVLGGQISDPGVSDLQTSVDVNSDWKMVLHDESNTYYYWNIVTGETSWEVPDVLAQGPELVVEPATVVEADGMNDAKMVGGIDVEPRNDTIVTSLVFEPKELDGPRPDVEVQNEEHAGDKEKVNHVSQSGVEKQSCQVLGSSNGDERYANSGILVMGDHAQEERMSDLSSRLMRFSEDLLGRLKSLRGSGVCEDEILKLRLGVEIRLFDMRSLLHHGSSLLPFWLHSENQLKQLESAIDDEVLNLCKSAKTNEIEPTRKLWESNSDDMKVDTGEMNAACSTSSDSGLSDHATSKEVGKASRNRSVVYSGNLPSVGYSYLRSDRDARGMVDSDIAVPAEVIARTGNHLNEDMDMDVEMEVEDPVPGNETHTGDVTEAQFIAPPVPILPPNPPSNHESLELDEQVTVPPPPDDDWIPPPPPDDEPFPPPPPDEPPEALYPPAPSEFQTIQPYSYAEHYNLTYQGSSFEYYSQTNTEMPGTVYYVDAGGNQVAAALPSQYYATVPNTYADSATLIVNSIEPVSYYSLQEVSVPIAPTASVLETSSRQTASVVEGLVPDQTGSLEVQNEVGFTPLPTAVADISTGRRGIEEASIDFPSIPASIHAPTSVPVSLDVSMVSAPAVPATVASTEAISKAQPKVARSKKRTVAVVSTLRSNKKVSGLVDKWKAAKEEMHDDDEDEPENAYEILEKKRQREIEQWRAQQIATGEAKDNANFQPLGGDWRERVKRKRAKRMSEAEQAPSVVLHDANQPADLSDLSKGLPSGWQAYWDDTSKQVYYGNSATSETTWTRPTH